MIPAAQNKIGRIELYASELEEREPNEETIAAMREADELARLHDLRLASFGEPYL